MICSLLPRYFDMPTCLFTLTYAILLISMLILPLMPFIMLFFHILSFDTILIRVLMLSSIHCWYIVASCFSFFAVYRLRFCPLFHDAVCSLILLSFRYAMLMLSLMRCYFSAAFDIITLLFAVCLRLSRCSLHACFDCFYFRALLPACSVWLYSPTLPDVAMLLILRLCSSACRVALIIFCRLFFSLLAHVSLRRAPFRFTPLIAYAAHITLMLAPLLLLILFATMFQMLVLRCFAFRLAITPLCCPLPVWCRLLLLLCLHYFACCSRCIYYVPFWCCRCLFTCFAHFFFFFRAFRAQRRAAAHLIFIFIATRFRAIYSLFMPRCLPCALFSFIRHTALILCRYAAWCFADMRCSVYAIVDILLFCCYYSDWYADVCLCPLLCRLLLFAFAWSSAVVFPYVACWGLRRTIRAMSSSACHERAAFAHDIKAFCYWAAVFPRYAYFDMFWCYYDIFAARYFVTYCLTRCYAAMPCLICRAIWCAILLLERCPPALLRCRRRRAWYACLRLLPPCLISCRYLPCFHVLYARFIADVLLFTRYVWIVCVFSFAIDMPRPYRYSSTVRDFARCDKDAALMRLRRSYTLWWCARAIHAAPRCTRICAMPRSSFTIERVRDAGVICARVLRLLSYATICHMRLFTMSRAAMIVYAASAPDMRSTRWRW